MVQYTVDPQVGQKRRVITLPCSPTRVNSVAVPSIITCVRSKRACTPNGEPVRFWHSRQWQMERRTGSPVQVTRSRPQLQAAVRLVRRSSVIPKALTKRG